MAEANDADCDQKTTQKCMSMVKEGSYSEMLLMLSQHRESLPAMMHLLQDILNFRSTMDVVG